LNNDGLKQTGSREVASATTRYQWHSLRLVW